MTRDRRTASFDERRILPTTLLMSVLHLGRHETVLVSLLLYNW
jgi:hypothetical protein